MSGVSRLRQSRKNHSTEVMTTGGPQGSGNTVKMRTGTTLTVPKKSSVLVTRNLPGITPPPISNEQPSRGEHGRNTSMTSKRNDSL